MDRELLRNGSGYVDPTAYNALNNVQKGINKMENMKANRFEPKQGDVYLVQKKDNKTGEFKKSPAVVVSADAYNEGSEFILMADITTGADPELPQNAPIMCRVPSVAVCDRLRNVKSEWIGDYIRTATDEEMHALADALGFVFGIVVNMTDVILKGGNPADLVENKALVARIEDQKEIIEEQENKIKELKMILREREKANKLLNTMNNEMAGIAVELEDSGQQSDFYRQFYHDLFHSDKKIEIKVG